MSLRLRLVAVVVALCALAAYASVSGELAVVVMLKVLTYDPGFDKRVPGDFVLVVPVSKDNPEQAAALKEIQPVGATLLSKRAVRLKQVSGDAASSLGEQGASAVLLLPGTPAAVADQWANAAASQKIYSLSLVPGDVNERVMLSVDELDGKPQLAVNHRLTANAGVNFPPSVLKVAKVIR